MASFHLNLYTPKGTIVKDLACREVIVPTVRGEIDILPDHTHILTELSTGILVAKTADEVRHFLITAGLCRVMGDVITILCFAAENPKEIDIERAKTARARALAKLSSELPVTDIELIKFQRKLERAEMRLRIANLK